MLHNGTQILFDYWRNLKADRPAPLRVEIEPSAIAKILPSTFILETNGEAAFQFRLAGTNICLFFGNELKSQTFDSLIYRYDRRLTHRLLKVVHSEHTVLQLLLHCFSETGREVFLECILLPLGDFQPRLLGAIHILDMPYWVGTERIISTHIASVRLMDADRSLISLHNRPSIRMPHREHLEDLRSKTPTFSVLDGGSMLASRQVLQSEHHGKKPNLTVVQGGLN
ncbi:MAG: PAS domain-containing protein [Ahrensia sp.]|nr:PAS domain-containing protein [Ahrensia sp.]